ncbi:MAG: hypothetical protein ACE5D0_06155 [Fidelibacterota bacterium]
MIEEMDFSECPSCGCKHFYHQKDFNKTAGCIIVLIGAILVPYTYGLSLMFVAVIDWLLYKRMNDEAVCYKCHKVYANVHIPDQMKEFDHHIAELYEEPD